MDKNWNHLIETTLSTQSIYKGRVISLQIDEVQLPNQTISTREVVKHPGAVAVLALHQDRLLVVTQYRVALQKIQVEIPAGKLEPGEDLLLAAHRELEEETGYKAQSLKHLRSFYTSPGFADEILHLFVAEQLVRGHFAPDEDEFVEASFISFDEAQQLMNEGHISDAKTMLAIYAWQVQKLTGVWN